MRYRGDDDSLSIRDGVSAPVHDRAWNEPPSFRASCRRHDGRRAHYGTALHCVAVGSWPSAVVQPKGW